MIAVWLVGSWFFASFQGTVDALRASGSMPWLVALAACRPLTDAPREWQVEALRGRRLSAQEREMTLWRELDRLELGSNVKDNSIVWPEPSERWPGERPLVAAVEKHCGQAEASLREELALADAQTPVMRYHRALLRYRLQLPTALEEEALPTELIADRDLLLAEQRRDPEAFEALERTRPELRSELRLRALQLSRDEAVIERLLADGAEGEIGDYFFALRMVRLERQKDWDAILTLADEHASTLGKDDNAAIARSVAASALIMRPFTRSSIALLEALHGRGRATREVFRVGALALARGEWAFARDAFTWTEANVKPLAWKAQAKLAALGLHVGDARMLKRALAALGETKSETLAVYEALLLEARAGPIGSAEALAALRAAAARFHAHAPQDARSAALTKELEAHALAGSRALRIELEQATQAFTPRAPEVRFAFREPFSLVPLP